jgi:hypothetical protein
MGGKKHQEGQTKLERDCLTKAKVGFSKKSEKEEFQRFSFDHHNEKNVAQILKKVAPPDNKSNQMPMMAK